MASRVRNGDSISNPPTCLLIEHKKAILLTIVALAAIGALVIGALAISGVGSISQLGLPGGGAVAGLGFFVLLVIVGYCAYKRCCSQSTEKRVSDDSESDRTPPKIHKNKTKAGHSSRSKKVPARSHHISKSLKSNQLAFDYQQASVRDLFIHVEKEVDKFENVPIYPDTSHRFPQAEFMTVSVMKGEMRGFGEFVCIKLKCVSPKEDILAKTKSGQDCYAGKELAARGRPVEGALILIKKNNKNSHWVQASNEFLISPAFLRSYDNECLANEPSESTMSEMERVENERDGFARLQTLLGSGEVTDCRGLRWEIVR